jgi:site-specific DNA-methyltransferase (adenine-specific)
MSERFLNDRVELHCGDCREVLATLDENSIDSCVTDPPYGLEFMGKEWDSFAPRDRKNAAVWDGRRQAQNGWEETSERSGKGGGEPSYRSQHKGSKRCTICGKRQFSGSPCQCAEPKWCIEHRQEAPSAMLGFQAYMTDWAREVYRVLKPGAHLVAFGGTRTYHRMACAIEDAGFEIRDTVSWLYGSGFPKSHDVSKGIDRAAGAEREVVGVNEDYLRRKPNGMKTEGAAVYGYSQTQYETDARVTAPATDAARQWEGWGTALKPACELIVLARKPLSEGTVAANVLRWGTGAINVGACRVEANDGANRARPPRTPNEILGSGKGTNLTASEHNAAGRWPANVVHDGSDEVVAAFPETADSTPGIRNNNNQGHEGWSGGTFRSGPLYSGHSDSGSAARFFYTAKADADDRLGSMHPTVKPLDLMQWLVRLVTPPKGTCLDPFAGTGTTGEAAWREGMRAVLIEAEAEYQADIRRRMALALAGPDERNRESIKAKNLPRDDGPLFAARDQAWADMWARPFDFSQLKDDPAG